MRTFCASGATIMGVRVWLSLVALLSAPHGISCGHHRRSMPTPTTYPVSKGGWRPVVSSALPGYGAFAAAPLHAPSYKIPFDNYPSSSRPVAARDTTKLTSIAQSYRPTTLRSLPATVPSHPNQPINSYFNPYPFNNGLSHYKFVQNYPVENVVIRNPHNPYAARPVYKYPPKYKQQFNNQYQQLSNVQPLQFAVPAYPTSKPHDVFGKPEMYLRPTEAKRPQSSGTEIFKPEVYKVPSDSDTAGQSLTQQVKTAQQQSQSPNSKPVQNGFPQYQYKDEKFGQLPPSVLGTFGSFGVQTIKSRDPVYPPAKTTYLPPQPSKQTIFNSFNFAPYFKTTPTHFPNTTPKFQTTLNQIHYGTNHDEYKTTPAQPTKDAHSVKADPNAGGKVHFKPSPQDPFAKPHQINDANKVQASTYNPNLQSTTSSGYYFNSFHGQPIQYSQNLNSYYNQPTFVYENKKQKIHDSLTSSVNQQSLAQFPESPKKKHLLEATQNSLPAPVTYEVTETYESDDATNSASNSWSAIPDTNDYSNNQQKPSDEELVTKYEYQDKQTTTPSTELPEEYSIVTESDKGFENSLNYDSHAESQTRRPLGDDFEPISKHKLKDYYYRVSTPAHEEYTTSHKRLKAKPTDATTSSAAPIDELTTHFHKYNENTVEALPTLPPNKHFKRPNAQEPIDKDKIRKRIKNRRRRPPLANINKDETSTRRSIQSSTETSHATEAEENYTIKPRVRPAKSKAQINFTTPTITTDLSTSALPTISPTSPTVVKKKIVHRRPLTTITDRLESTTTFYKDNDVNKESPIMKIATRSQHPRVTTATYDYKLSDLQDFSHKQDEKDTPTSDVSVSITESLRNKPEPNNQFSFHKDVKPIEAKLEPVRQSSNTETPKRDSSEDSLELATTTLRNDNDSESTNKVQRPRPKNKYEHSRPKFSVKDYRNRLSSTTTTTEKSTESNTPKFRFPQRRIPFDFKNSSDNETERKKFIPKDPRHKNGSSNDSSEPQTEKETHSTRQPTRQRHTASSDHSDGTTQKISSRIRNGSRRPRPTEETTETSSPTTVHIKRPLRKKIKDSDIGESVHDVAVTETTVHYETVHSDMTSERTRSESAIMKIAKDEKKHPTEHEDHIFEHSKRVSDLTLAASKDYNTPGMFKTVSPNSRRIPNYFTIATDDPILPIEAFFPQLNQKKES